MADGLINLYPLLVNYTFGGLLMAGIGVGIIITILAFFTRISRFLLTVILFCYVLAYGIGYVGALVAIPAFILSFMYFWTAAANWLLQKYS